MEIINRRIAVRGIVIHDNKILLVRLKHTKVVPEWVRLSWCLPGGGLWDDEAITDGLIREMIEETGVRPFIGNLLYINQFNSNDKNHIEFFFHVKNSEDYLNPDISKSSHGLEELEEIDFKDLKSTPILPEFLTQEDVIRHIEKNEPTKIFTTI